MLFRRIRIQIKYMEQLYKQQSIEQSLQSNNST